MSNFQIVHQQRIMQIYDEKELMDKLKEIMVRDDAFFCLSAPNGDELTVSITGGYGFVEFVSQTRQPPYLHATLPGKNWNLPAPHPFFSIPSSQGENLITLPLFNFQEEPKKGKKEKRTGQKHEKQINFSVGGTPTPLPMSQCVSLKDVVSILRHYFLHQELLQSFEWESA